MHDQCSNPAAESVSNASVKISSRHVANRVSYESHNSSQSHRRLGLLEIAKHIGVPNEPTTRFSIKTFVTNNRHHLRFSGVDTCVLGLLWVNALGQPGSSGSPAPHAGDHCEWLRHFARLIVVAITTDARRRNAVLYREERLRIEPSRVEWMRIGHSRDLFRKCSREMRDRTLMKQTKRKKPTSSFSHQIQSSKVGTYIYCHQTTSVDVVGT